MVLMGGLGTLVTNIFNAAMVITKFSCSRKQENQTSHVCHVFVTRIYSLTLLTFSHGEQFESMFAKHVQALHRVEKQALRSTYYQGRNPTSFRREGPQPQKSQGILQEP